MFGKIFFVKFSSKIVLKVSRMKFVGKKIEDISEKYWRISRKFCDIPKIL